MRNLIAFMLLFWSGYSVAAGNCEKLLCVSTGVGRTSVNECKNDSLKEFYQDVWDHYDEDYCDETHLELNKGENWNCDLSGGPGTPAMVSISTICIEVYNIKIRVANIVNVNMMPGAIVVGGSGIPIGGGGGGGGGGDSASANMQPKEIEYEEDGETHHTTVTGKVVCNGGKCGPQDINY